MIWPYKTFNYPLCNNFSQSGVVLENILVQWHLAKILSRMKEEFNLNWVAARPFSTCGKYYIYRDSLSNVNFDSIIFTNVMFHNTLRKRETRWLSLGGGNMAVFINNSKIIQVRGKCYKRLVTWNIFLQILAPITFF